MRPSVQDVLHGRDDPEGLPKLTPLVRTRRLGCIVLS